LKNRLALWALPLDPLPPAAGAPTPDLHISHPVSWILLSAFSHTD